MLVCYTKLHAFNVFYMIDECHLNGRPTRVSRRKTKGRRRLTNWPVNVEASHHHHWNTSQQQISLHDDDVEDLYFSFVGVLVHLIIVYCLSCSYCCCCCCYPLFFIWIREVMSWDWSLLSLVPRLVSCLPTKSFLFWFRPKRFIITSLCWWFFINIFSIFVFLKWLSSLHNCQKYSLSD